MTGHPTIKVEVIYIIFFRIDYEKWKLIEWILFLGFDDAMQKICLLINPKQVG